MTAGNEKIMPVRSMTGFGSGSCGDASCRIDIELKAVNNRYFDVSLRVPMTLRRLEPLITEKLSAQKMRGKIDVSLKYATKGDNGASFAVNKVLLKNYLQALNEAGQEIGANMANLAVQEVLQITSYPGIIELQEAELDYEHLSILVSEALEKALDEFIAMKEKEGEKLVQDISKRAAKIRDFAAALSDLAPQLIEQQHNRLCDLLHEHLKENEVDEARLVQEVALYGEKINYTEEIVRLDSHLSQFEATIKKGGNIGRKLDFIVQEMNREINTTASKANSAQASRLAVEIKSEIEKIREQIQNIE